MPDLDIQSPVTLASQLYGITSEETDPLVRHDRARRAAIAKCADLGVAMGEPALGAAVQRRAKRPRVEPAHRVRVGRVQIKVNPLLVVCVVAPALQKPDVRPRRGRVARVPLVEDVLVRRGAAVAISVDDPRRATVVPLVEDTGGQPDPLLAIDATAGDLQPIARMVRVQPLSARRMRANGRERQGRREGRR